MNANAKYFSDQRRAAMANWENKAIDIRTDEVAFIMRRKAAMSLAMVKVLEQNDVDVFVYPPLLALPGKIGQPSGGGGGSSAAGHGFGARLGVPEVFVPAGFATEIYEPTFALKADGTGYTSTPGTTATKLERPLPFTMGFSAGPGDEAVVLKVASAYENATHHRAPPAGFGPLPGQRQSSAR